MNSVIILRLIMFPLSLRLPYLSRLLCPSLLLPQCYSHLCYSHLCYFHMLLPPLLLLPLLLPPLCYSHSFTPPCVSPISYFHLCYSPLGYSSFVTLRLGYLFTDPDPCCPLAKVLPHHASECVATALHTTPHSLSPPLRSFPPSLPFLFFAVCLQA